MYIFVKFSFFDPIHAKEEASILTKLTDFWPQHLKLRKSCRGQIFIFSRFYLSLKQKFAKFDIKIEFLELQEPIFQIWNKKSKFQLLQDFFISKYYN